MKKTIKKISISILSVAGISILIWVILLFNPSLSYANKTQIGQVSIFHNQELTAGTEEVVYNALEIIKKSDIYTENLNIQLCLNDDNIYPNLYPNNIYAFASSNRTILKKGDYMFNENRVEVYWENYMVNQSLNLTWVLAHEFTHNMQNNAKQVCANICEKRKISWKLEGHADYIAREFKNDGRLTEKINDYLIKSQKGEYLGPIFFNKDGTKVIHSYYKYALIYQYLTEIKNMHFDEICQLDMDVNRIYSEMIEWKNN